jgi:uncharacterized protein (UPF0333 family)
MTVVGQVTNSANSVEEVTFWLKLNGSDYPNSATTVTLPARKSAEVPSSTLVTVTFVGTSTAVNDYVQVYWHGTSTSLSLNHSVAGTSPVHPVTPSVIVGITQVMYTQVGQTGAIGPTGATGLTGNTGATGLTGNTGLAGIVYSATAPVSTDVLWGDTTVNGTQMAFNDLNDVAITSAATGQTVLYNGTNFVNTTPPSYNYIINGAFDIWQRGTSFASAVSNTYSADRWRAGFDGTGVRTISRQAFTLGTAPVSGYEGRFFYRYNQTTAGTGATFSNVLEQRIESVRTVAGETITISFWAKADATRTVTPIMTQYFGTGGSPSASTATYGSAKTLTTSWANYTATVTLPSLSGKTIGTDGNDSIILTLQSSTVNATQTIDIWGVQVEEGSIATPFRRNAPSPQAELAACQRYYQRVVAITTYALFASGVFNTTTNFYMPMHLPVTLRTVPAVSWSGAFRVLTSGAGVVATLVIYESSTNPVSLAGTITGSTTDGQAGVLGANNDAAAYIEFDSEL